MTISAGVLKLDISLHLIQGRMLSHSLLGLSMKLVSFTSLSGYTLCWEGHIFFVLWVAKREHQQSQSSEVLFSQKYLQLSCLAPLRILNVLLECQRELLC